MNHDGSAYGMWGLVLIESAFFIIFAFSFTRPKTRTDWRSLGAFSAFIGIHPAFAITSAYRTVKVWEAATMDRIISLLLFAAFFYFMMRFGCGAHMVHGHHHGGHQGTGPSTGGSSKDPVCGMDVAPDTGYSEKYQSREYRFCSRKCLDKFDANPGQFARA